MADEDEFDMNEALRKLSMGLHPSSGHPENQEGQMKSMLGREIYDLQIEKERTNLRCNEKMAEALIGRAKALTAVISLAMLLLVLLAVPCYALLWIQVFS